MKATPSSSQFAVGSHFAAGSHLAISSQFGIPLLTALFLLTATEPAHPQSPAPASDPFRALILPAPNELRTGSGRPGPRYWQQQVNYKIDATLAPTIERASLIGSTV